jgi:serine/threonine protein kinase
LQDAIERAVGSRPSSAASSRAKNSAPGSLSRSDAGAASTQPPIAEGTVLAQRYRLDRLLGEGGMSQVWAATHLLTTRTVAVKLLRAALNAQPDMRRRLLREARAASSFEHRNVVDVHDIFELEDGTPVMVMALLHGQTLGDGLTAAARFGVADAANLLLPVVSAVGTAHAAGIVHRDLKPDNIFLAEEAGQTLVKVLDFGIAKLVSSEEQDAGSRTGTGILVGTPGYMAPEQCFGDRDIDHRADIWSLGAILYEVLTGTRALSGDNLGQVIKGALSNGIVAIEKLVPSLPVDISTLIGRMLAAERDERPADLREAFDVLARYAEIQCPAIPPPMSRQSAPVDSGCARSSPAPLAFARTEQAGAELARRSR